jgi:aldehyde:ferredoxin oxidoreductase
MAEAINAATGMSFTPDTLTDAHKRRRLLEMTHIQLCNRAHEVEEFFPVKMLEPKKDGKFAGHAIDIEKLPQVIVRYFELMGIDPDTHLPLRSELERLDLGDVADMLEEKGLVESAEISEEIKEAAS